MKLKRFNTYVKENIDMDMDMEEDVEMKDNFQDVPEFDNNKIEEDDVETEEETHEYKGNILMKELAEKLGVKVINNSIEYKGQKINFFSETEAFHVGRKKFDTMEEVIDFLKN